MKIKVLVSVSGGETSATLAKLLIDKHKLTPVLVFSKKGIPHYTKLVNSTHEFIFVFSNTSREDNRTLIFVKNLMMYMGIPIVWVEAEVRQGRIGTTFTETNYNKAKRNGEVFESVIKKYGIPNTQFIHCTRELKMSPIKSFAKSIGWDDYQTAIGYRADEPKRINLINAKKQKQIYPLYEWAITKSDVKHFWSKQSFNLGLLEWEGNCKLCYKKSKRKLLTQIIADPKSTEWIKEMEVKYSGFKKDGRSNLDEDYKTFFFRDNESIDLLIAESKEPFVPVTEKNYLQIQKQIGLFDYNLDEQEDCSESCEPFN